MWIVLLLLVLVCAYLGFEYWTNVRRLRLIPIRVYVNGTRGKSSVARLIAAALRAGGIRTVGKTTGSSPRFLFPDGSEVLIRRLGTPNIKEQLKVVRWARQYDARAIVVECMALQPYTQWLSEHRMIRSTIGVCTNVRADHLDVMGPTVAEVERALAGTVPEHAAFFTAERQYNRVLREACHDNGTSFEVVSVEDAAAVTPAELAGFSYLEHADNVALALKVATHLGVPRGVALKGMQGCTPDIGALKKWELQFFGRRIAWVNGFAANDPDSYRILWKLLHSTFAGVEARIVVANCRDDRPDRSRQLGELAAEMPDVDRFLLIGTGTEVFARAALKAGVPQERIYTMVGEGVDKVFERIVALSGASSVVFGIGNIKGVGVMLDEYFCNRAQPAQRR